MNSLKSKSKSKKIIKFLLIVIFSFTVIGIIALSAGIYGITYGLQLDDSKFTSEVCSVNVYDKNGQIINSNKYISNQSSNCTIPDLLKNAFISVEDKRFYKHNGVDYYRIAGALINNIKAHSFKEGASTISQQVIKNSHLTNEKTISRKIKEMKLAKDLENNYTKDEILDIYLNILYMGNGIYGVNNAAKFYFNKTCSELTVLESASIAAIVKNPSKYSPIKHIDNLESRAKIVVQLMYDNDYISNEIYIKAKNDKLNVDLSAYEQVVGNSYLSSAIFEAASKLDISEKELMTQNYSIYTNYDSTLQNQLHEKINSKNFSIKNAKGSIPDTCSIIMDNETGEIIAYSATNAYNAYNFKRQIGSLMKPLAVYAPAIDIGLITQATIFNDTIKSFDGYSPSNFNNKYYGYVDATYALAKSLNIPAVEILNDMGISTSSDYLSRMNLELSSEDGLATALGGTTNGYSLQQVCGGYATIANYGIYKEPYFVREIRDRNGKTIYKKSNNSNEINKVFSSETAYLMTDMLKSVVSDGTAKKLLKQYDIAAKTGTVGGINGGNNDAWCAAFTTQNTIICWQGNSKNSQNNDLPANFTGGNTPTLLVSSICDTLYKEKSPENFIVPEGIVKLKIDKNAKLIEHKIELMPEFAPSELSLEYNFNILNMPTELSQKYKQLSPQDIDIFYDKRGYHLSIKTTDVYDYEVYLNDIFGRHYIIDEIKAVDGINNFSIGLFDSIKLKSIIIKCYFNGYEYLEPHIIEIPV